MSQDSSTIATSTLNDIAEQAKKTLSPLVFNEDFTARMATVET